MHCASGPISTGGAFIAYSNGDGTYPGQAFIDCGQGSTSATIFRTGLGGTVVTRFQITHIGDALFAPPSNTGKGLVVKALASQSGNLQEWQDSSASPQSLINKQGYVVTRRTEAPSDLQNNELTFWFDKNSDPPKFRIRARDGTGAYYSGSVDLDD